MRPTRSTGTRPGQRGAALLVAMVLVTVVATLASGMVWQQWRAVQVEVAERARVQAAWILLGAQDWARLILREHRSEYTSLHDAWAQPLAEARLSTFLAADRNNTLEGAPDAFLSGQIVDAQARYNLHNLVDGDGKLVDAEKKTLARLCHSAGLSSALVDLLAQGMVDAGKTGVADAPLAPSRVEDLAWLGVDEASLAALRPWVTLLPERTPVNLNTAPREVLAAVIEGIDLGTADRLVQARLGQPFRSLQDDKLPTGVTLDPARVGVKSTFFEVRGRLRLEDRVLDELSLVHKRTPSDVVTRQRQRTASVLPGVPG